MHGRDVVNAHYHWSKQRLYLLPAPALIGPTHCRLRGGHRRRLSLLGQSCLCWARYSEALLYAPTSTTCRRSISRIVWRRVGPMAWHTGGLASLRALLLAIRAPKTIVFTLDHAVLHGVLTQREWICLRNAARALGSQRCHSHPLDNYWVKALYTLSSDWNVSKKMRLSAPFRFPRPTGSSTDLTVPVKRGEQTVLEPICAYSRRNGCLSAEQAVRVNPVY